MADEQKSKLRLAIAHVLFIDIVGYSKLRTNEQSAQMEKLREIVRGTEQYRIAEAEGKLLRLPTGDGGALAFRNNPETPVLCAKEIAKALKGNNRKDYLFGLKQEFESYQFFQKKIAECDTQINSFLQQQINTDPSKKNFQPQ